MRKIEDGGNIKSKQYQAHTNDLIYSKIDLKSGVIGFVPDDLEGGIVTAVFPLVSMPNITEIDRAFLMIYTNASNYGYVDFEQRDYFGKREFTADEYVAFCGTHCDHIVIPEAYKSKFFDGLREAVLEAGNKIVFHDTFVLFLAKKPI